VLGTAATAALLRRAAKRAEPNCPELNDMKITLNGFHYDYRLPERWAQADDEQGLKALRCLALELGPLLTDLAGPVLIRRLARLDPLREHSILFTEEGQP
jgi:hypothetical protein